MSQFRIPFVLSVLFVLPEWIGVANLGVMLSLLITFAALLVTPFRFLRFLLVSALALASCFHLGYVLYAGKRIDSYFWLAMFSTNSNESISFFSGLGPLNTVLMILYLLSLCFGAYYWERNRSYVPLIEKIKTLAAMFFVVVICFSVEFGLTDVWRLNAGWNVYPLHILSQYKESAFYLEKIFLPTAKADAVGEPFFDRIVLVIGESLTKTRMSLYGYSKKTTPHLDRRNDLIVYRNMFAPGLNTQPNLKTFFSGKLSDGIQGIEMDIFRLAKIAGYHVSYVDNNKYKNRDPIYMIGSQADEFVSLNGIGETNKKTDQTIKWDQELTPHYLNYLAQNKKRHLIVLHMAGSHTDQSQRYPPEFEKFQSHYDNSVFYTDFLLHLWLEELKKTSKKEKTLFVFVSDHGVKLPPGCGMGEIPSPEWNSYGSDDRFYSNLAIPLFFWVSDKAKKDLGPAIKNLWKNSQEPLDHRFFLPSLATAFGVEQIEGFEIRSKSLFLPDKLQYIPRLSHSGLDMDRALETGQICRE